MSEDTAEQSATDETAPQEAPSQPGLTPQQAFGAATNNIEAPEKTPEQGVSEVSDPWFWSEDVTGDGEKPEWMVDKFKTVEDQASAYGSLEKKMGGFTGAPEDYDFNPINDFLKDSHVKIDMENSQFQEFTQIAKKNNMSQDVMNDILKVYSDYEISRTPNPADELASLGADGERKIDLIAQWANSNFGAEEVNTISGMLNTASNISLLDKIRQLSGGGISPPSNRTLQQKFDASLTAVKLNEMVASPEYNESEVYRNEVTRKFNEYYNK